MDRPFKIVGAALLKVLHAETSVFAMFGIDNRPASDDLRVRGGAYVSMA